MASAKAALQMCLDLGQRLDDPNSLTLIQPLVGIAIQRTGLEAMAAAAPDAEAAQAIQKRLNDLNQERAGIKALVVAQPIESWLPTAPPEDINAYFDRMRLFGEQRALQWMANRRTSLQICDRFVIISINKVKEFLRWLFWLLCLFV